jgi:hypothetical protein
MPTTPMTVVELGRFLNDTKAIMSDDERARLLFFIASNPEAGDITSARRSETH